MLLVVVVAVAAVVVVVACEQVSPTGGVLWMADQTCALTVDGRHIATCGDAGMWMRRRLRC